MCSDNNGYNCNSSYSPKRAKDEISGFVFLVLFVVGIISSLIAISYIQNLYNDLVNFIQNIF